MNYSKYRQTSRRPNFRTAAEVTAGILVLLSLHGWMQYRDARDALHEQRARTQLVAANLAACMNGGTVYDNSGGVGARTSRGDPSSDGAVPAEPTMEALTRPQPALYRSGELIRLSGVMGKRLV